MEHMQTHSEQNNVPQYIQRYICALCNVEFYGDLYMSQHVCWEPKWKFHLCKTEIWSKEACNNHICDKHPYQSIEEQVRSKNRN